LVSFDTKVRNELFSLRQVYLFGPLYSRASEVPTPQIAYVAYEVKMSTVTKKELIDRIAETTQAKRVIVKRIVQSFLDEIMTELSNDNRLEFRDFGVFETRTRVARIAQNPKTLERVKVPAKRTVKFKMGRLMKEKLINGSIAAG